MSILIQIVFIQQGGFMKKHLILVAIFFLAWNFGNFAAEVQENNFYELMRDVSNRIKDYAFLSEFASQENLNKSNITFKTIILPSLISAYERSNMTNRVIWLNIVRDVRKYDRTEIEKNRPTRWYLGNLLDLTLGLELSEINDAWLKGLWEAYRDSLYDPL